jgi:prevent-host-death family protein
MRSSFKNHIRRSISCNLFIGVREAKISLSKMLKMVKNGNEVILTDRGRPVGKIVPLEEESLPLDVRIKSYQA